ncbi:hypothetical protein KY327_00175 [Candidatus Woesearchaeota archaeon]|nr:hypothetical protein [Candidatus Woesearchaeota archaeon]
MRSFRNISGPWLFLIIVLTGYVAVAFFDSAGALVALEKAGRIFLRVLPVFAIVLVLMALANKYVTAKTITKHLKGRSWRGWTFAVVGGIISTGPIYLWYPLLADLRKKGLPDGMVVCFLYNRAVKLPLLPLIVVYFGWTYTLVLTTTMILASLLQGAIMNRRWNYETSDSG